MWMVNGKKLNNYIPPFGYEYADEEKNTIRPIEKDLQLLEEIKELLDVKALSLREAAIWLSAHASRKISFEALRVRLKRPVYLEIDCVRITN